MKLLCTVILLCSLYYFTSSTTTTNEGFTNPQIFVNPELGDDRHFNTLLQLLLFQSSNSYSRPSSLIHDTEKLPLASVELSLSLIREYRRKLSSVIGISSAYTLPITVNLLPGVHRLSAPLKFSKDDSFITFIGTRDPIISGGIPINGFSQCTQKLWCAQVLSLPESIRQSRQFYINGNRMSRARASESVVSAFQNPISYDVNKYVVPADSGIEAWLQHDIMNNNNINHNNNNNINNNSFVNIGTIEFLFTSESASPWTESRCTVLNITNGSLVNGKPTFNVFMKQPCFYLLQNKPCGQGEHSPTAIENTIIDDMQPGNWYFDRAQSIIYVYPTSDHFKKNNNKNNNINTNNNDIGNNNDILNNNKINNNNDDIISAEFPVLETLIESYDSQYLSFSGITFSYATWSRPSGPLGYVEQQSGAILSQLDTQCNDNVWFPMPSNLRFFHTNQVSFVNCNFNHLGAGALQFTSGSHYSNVTGCVFNDISGTSVQIGDYNTSRVSDPDKQELYNYVNDCEITNVATEYHGCCGIQVGYAAHTTLSHLDISDLSYGGISIGWGWSRELITYSNNNSIYNNYIHNIKNLLGDGGGIYALGIQYNSTMYQNWISCMGSGRGGGGYYPDEGSAYWDIGNNVFSNATCCSDACEWLHIWTSSIHDIYVHDSYTDTSVMQNHGTNTKVVNTFVKQQGQDWPPAAKLIMSNAGRLKKN